MTFQNSDGTPKTYTLFDLEEMGISSVANSRTLINRKTLTHVGRRPYAGDERKFTIAGVLEAAIVMEAAASTSFAAASVVADSFLRHLYGVAILSGRASDGPPVSPYDPTDVSSFDENPQVWWGGALEHKDLADPALIVWLQDAKGVIGVQVVRGWSEIQRARNSIVKGHFSVMRQGILKANERNVAVRIADDDPALFTEWPVCHVMNLTAILANIEKSQASEAI